MTTLFHWIFHMSCLGIIALLAGPVQADCLAYPPLTTPDTDFANAGPGMVTHTPTGLIWKRCAEGQTWDGSACAGVPAVHSAWQDAFARAAAVNTGTPGTQGLGYTDWRVPTISELRSLVERSCYPAINLNQFPNFPLWDLFWSSSPVVTRLVGVYGYGPAWYLHFGTGSDSSFDWNHPTAVLLVRGGKSFLNYDAVLTSLSQGLIDHYYQSILGRDPDSGGMSYWQNEISRLQGLGVDVREAFRVMAGWFFGSPEYLAKNTSDNEYVTDLYRAFFQRNPDGGGFAFWTGQLGQGLPRSIVLFSFLFSPEFGSYMQGLLGNTASRAEVYAVADFYRGFLNRLPDPAGFGYWLNRFRIAQCQGATTVNGEFDSISFQFSGSGEYLNRNRTNRDYVADLYYAFLRRGGDLNGFNYWINQLDSGTQTREQLRIRFLNSPEFQQNRVTPVLNQGCFQ